MKFEKKNSRILWNLKKNPADSVWLSLLLRNTEKCNISHTYPQLSDTWAASWQNQQTAQSDQSLRCALNG